LDYILGIGGTNQEALVSLKRKVMEELHQVLLNLKEVSPILGNLGQI